MTWSQSTGSLTTLQETTKDWNDYLRPLDGYVYFIEKMGINGRIGFALQFPKGVTHGAPRGQTHYMYYAEASHINPIYYPFLVIPPDFPTWKLYNPDGSTRTAYGYFYGKRWRVSKLEPSQVTPDIEKMAVELTDLAKGGIGQG